MVVILRRVSDHLTSSQREVGVGFDVVCARDATVTGVERVQPIRSLYRANTKLSDKRHALSGARGMQPYHARGNFHTHPDTMVYRPHRLRIPTRVWLVNRCCTPIHEHPLRLHVSLRAALSSTTRMLSPDVVSTSAIATAEIGADFR